MYLKSEFLAIYYSAKELLGGIKQHKFIFENNVQRNIKIDLEKSAKELF